MADGLIIDHKDDGFYKTSFTNKKTLWYTEGFLLTKAFSPNA
jgi:hypothetical protein